MAEITHRFVEANGLRIHVAEAGEGPLVLLCHGFPESWYSWRHQLSALAEAGYHAVAPDMRGYGQTDRPEAIEAYTLFHLDRRHGRASSTRSAPIGRSWSVTTGARRSPGIARSSGPIVSAAWRP